MVKSFAVGELKVVHTQFWQKEAIIKRAWMKSGDETFKNGESTDPIPKKKKNSPALSNQRQKGVESNIVEGVTTEHILPRAWCLLIFLIIASGNISTLL